MTRLDMTLPDVIFVNDLLLRRKVLQMLDRPRSVGRAR
jgi:hypothetical protein